MDVLSYFAENKDGWIAVAAIGALVTSSITAFLSFIATIKAKKIDIHLARKAAMRDLVRNDMDRIGQAMHETLARSEILIKKFELSNRKARANLSQSIKQYKKRITASNSVLRQVKIYYRYKFYELEEGLATISRSSDWIKSMQDDVFLARRIIGKSDQIRMLIDKSLIRAYRDGEHISRISRFRIRMLQWRIKSTWNARKYMRKFYWTVQNNPSKKLSRWRLCKAQSSLFMMRHLNI